MKLFQQLLLAPAALGLLAPLAANAAEVNINDVLVTISSWGTNGPLGDVNYDGIVDVEDLLTVIDSWGPCP